MKIAVLEDDPQLRQHLVRILQKQGWATIDLDSMEQLETCLLVNKDVDLFIIDRLIGRRDSVDQLGRIKKLQPQARVLILSSIDLPEEKAKWLMAGADEYMGKPVFSDELTARIHLLRNRNAHSTPSIIQIQDLSIDKFKHQVTRGRFRIDVTAKEFAVLLLLVESPSRVFNKNQILEHVWGFDSAVETNVVESTINNLRRKLESAESSVAILSRRNVGYWIET